MRPAVPSGAAIIGTGYMARVHTAAIRASGGVVLGIAGRSAERGQLAAQRLDIRRAFDSTDELIDSEEVRVVHVCTPNASHAAFAIRALRAGKDVVCEKPLALSPREASGIAEAVEESGRRLAVAFVYRYHPMAREASVRVRRGELGAVHSMAANYLQDWLLLDDDDDWRTNPEIGGRSRAFADIGSHAVDLVEFITGERIARVSALTRTVVPKRGGRTARNEDLASVHLVTQSGAIGQILISQIAAGFKNDLTVTVFGRERSLTFHQERPDTLWLGERDRGVVLSRDPSMLSAEAAALSSFPAGHPMGYQDAFNAFIADAYRAFAGLDAPALPDLEAGMRSVAVTEAVLASAELGTWTDIPLPLRTVPVPVIGGRGDAMAEGSQS